MKLYTFTQAEQLINKYLSKGGEVHVINEGSLAHGLVVATADGYKSAVIKEVYLNHWSSMQSIRLYNELPKKYQTLINNL